MAGLNKGIFMFALSLRGVVMPSQIPCYQVLAQFAFYQHRPALVSTSIKKQTAPAHLVLSGLPFGHGLKCRRFFRTEKEAVQYVSYLHTIYANRTVPASLLSHGQLSLF
jgi:hypothetical protein